MNIRNQKGATGTDIIVAATIIVFTMAVVSMIYVNTTFESRNVTRTAGATRIATNILENIEKLPYEEFITSFNGEIAGVSKQTSGDFNGYYLLNGGSDKKVFSTSIPRGYDLYMKAELNYGSHTNTAEQFDLVREIQLIVAFSVGDRVEKVDFKTVKAREVLYEANKPSTDYLTSAGILKSGMNFYPVKYVDTTKSYVKTTENDSGWYSYSNKKWATVVVSRRKDSELFDVNGKFVGKIDTNTASATYTVKMVWIPRFFTKNNVFHAFAYQGNGNNKIVSTTLNSVKGSSSTLTLNTFRALQTGTGQEDVGVSTNTTNFAGRTGKWVSAEGNGITSDADASKLNSSKYGPYMTN